MVVSGIAVVLALCALVLAAVGARVSGTVTRARVHRFAAREALAVTVGNGDSVIRYLATTRRWRSGLLCLALLGFSWLPVATRQGVTVSFLGAFSGWFVGAVIAEWRVDGLTRGAQASALLRARRLTDYVEGRAVAFVLLVWLVAAALGIVAAVRGLDRIEGAGVAMVMLLAGAVVATVLVGVVRRILGRPQPLVAEDLLEADHAFRGRSLNVLLGSALAIGGYLLAGEVDQISTGNQSGPEFGTLLVGYLLLPGLGVVVATRPTAMSRHRAQLADRRGDQ